MESHFWYNKGQRNGILFLLLGMLCLQALIHFGDFSLEDDEADSHQEEFAILRKRIDSLQSTSRKKQQAIRPFNPNYLTDFKGYRIGMSTEEIDRLLGYRATGRFLNSAEEFRQITGISDSLFVQISPYLKFPKKRARAKDIRTTDRGKASRATKSNPGDLNAVTASELLDIPGVDEQLARRIVSYRNLIHGYSMEDQLLEVYHLDPSTAQRILNSFPIRSRPIIDRLDINTASFREVLKLPYIDYGLTRRIFRYKDSVKRIQSLEELKKLDSFPLEKFDRIALYLQAD